MNSKLQITFNSLSEVIKWVNNQKFSPLREDTVLKEIINTKLDTGKYALKADRFVVQDGVLTPLEYCTNSNA